MGGKKQERPLTPTQIEVLRHGAESSGPAGVVWEVNGKQCSPAVRGLARRGLVIVLPDDGHKRTFLTEAGRRERERLP